MGITIFDLFNEIIAEEDMVKFLKDKGPKGEVASLVFTHVNLWLGVTDKDYNGAALVLRCFLLLVDLSHGLT